MLCDYINKAKQTTQNMKLTHIQLDSVAAYVKGELSGEALTDFKIALAMNETLREEVAFQRSLLSAVRLNVAVKTLEQSTLNNLLKDKTLHPEFSVIQKNIQQARTDNSKRQRRIRKHWMLGLTTAACVFLIGIVGLNTYLNSQLDSDMEEIVAMVEYRGVSLKENIKEVSARRTVIVEELNRAEQMFEDKNWLATQDIFEYLRDTLLYNSTEMDFCEGIIFYYKEQYVKSVEKLEGINLEDSQSVCQIRHFLTLSYLKIKNKSKAKEEYEMLTKDSQQCDKQTVKQLKKYFIL